MIYIRYSEAQPGAVHFVDDDERPVPAARIFQEGYFVEPAQVLIALKHATSGAPAATGQAFPPRDGTQ